MGRIGEEHQELDRGQRPRVVEHRTDVERRRIRPRSRGVAIHRAGREQRPRVDPIAQRATVHRSRADQERVGALPRDGGGAPRVAHRGQARGRIAGRVEHVAVRVDRGGQRARRVGDLALDRQQHVVREVGQQRAAIERVGHAVDRRIASAATRRDRERDRERERVQVEPGRCHVASLAFIEMDYQLQFQSNGRRRGGSAVGAGSTQSRGPTSLIASRSTAGSIIGTGARPLSETRVSAWIATTR